MKALTSPGVSHQKRDGQSLRKLCLSVVYYIFPVMVNVMMSAFVDSSLVLSLSASCLTCAGDELAMKQWSLFRKNMTEPHSDCNSL